ncbi:lipopolysaccharide assembly protein LapA domain-containing protein [Pseudomonas sp. AMR01]|uniref:lipopolysaccharide assembly protein LapA domain-containing protein n=1 Tax=Pseudomonas sp. AMR01 TaxID=3064904 RepID=UPI0035C1C6C1
MRGVKRVALVTTALVAALVVIGFVLENQQSVSLSFFGWATAQIPVAIFIVLALILGMLIGPLLGVVVCGRRRKLPSAGRG